MAALANIGIVRPLDVRTEQHGGQGEGWFDNNSSTCQYPPFSATIKRFHCSLSTFIICSVWRLLVNSLTPRKSWQFQLYLVEMDNVTRFCLATYAATQLRLMDYNDIVIAESSWQYLSNDTKIISLWSQTRKLWQFVWHTMSIISARFWYCGR